MEMIELLKKLILYRHYDHTWLCCMAIEFNYNANKPNERMNERIETTALSILLVPYMNDDYIELFQPKIMVHKSNRSDLIMALRENNQISYIIDHEYINRIRKRFNDDFLVCMCECVCITMTWWQNA